MTDKFVEMMEQKERERQERRKAFRDRLYADEEIEKKRRLRDLGIFDPETGEMFIPRTEEDLKRKAKLKALEKTREFEKNQPTMEEIEQLKLRALAERARNAESDEEKQKYEDRFRRMQEAFNLSRE